MKVYIYIFKRFFNQLGTDFAAAVDNDQIKVFRKKSYAEYYRQQIYEYEASLKEDLIKKESVIKKDGQNALVITFNDNSRYAFEIVEKELNGPLIKLF